jgi:hypothetical protein
MIHTQSLFSKRACVNIVDIFTRVDIQIDRVDQRFPRSIVIIIAILHWFKCMRKEDNQGRQEDQQPIKNDVACIGYWMQRFFDSFWCWCTVCVSVSLINPPVDSYSWLVINWVIYFAWDEQRRWSFVSISHINDAWSLIVSRTAVPLWYLLIDLWRMGESSHIFIMDDLPSSYHIIVTDRTWKIWWSAFIA